MSELPAPPAGTVWRVDVRPGRTMPTEVTVSLRYTRWPRSVVASRSSQCGSFFDRESDSWFFKSVVGGLARECLDPPEKPYLRGRWFEEMRGNR